jgi:protocatechuate 3,4-dioxygenase beta subunit
VLTESGIVRRDIRPSFGSASGVADGVPLTVNLTVVDAAGGSTPLAGAAVYAWHCTRDGEYSLYSQSIADENYLRGVQEADAGGALSFMSIFPGCYSGRWPHIHLEVYATLADATGGGSPIATSQLALPEDACATVYATGGYSQSVQNLARTSLESDMVFSDGYAQQLATTTGSVAAGYVAELSVGV